MVGGMQTATKGIRALPTGASTGTEAPQATNIRFLNGEMALTTDNANRTIAGQPKIAFAP